MIERFDRCDPLKSFTINHRRFRSQSFRYDVSINHYVSIHTSGCMCTCGFLLRPKIAGKNLSSQDLSSSTTVFTPFPRNFDKIGEVDMAQIFRQFRESKISASILIEASSSSALQKAQVVTEAKDAIADPPVDTSLLVFIVESAIAEKAAINVVSVNLSG